jgi:regulator of protease activity HflC (stomatin/prohibitin superfamily)
VWTSETLRSIESKNLSEKAVIVLGPYTILTVDEGYVAVTQNNGKQDICAGGKTHFLNHANWKFEKFMTLKVQTDELESIQATSADNINMRVTSTVNWRIVDPVMAATMAAETMGSDSSDMRKLRRDVLKQALASLAAFIGSVNYSSSFHVSAASNERDKRDRAPGELVRATAVAEMASEKVTEVSASAPAAFMDNPLYDSDKMDTAMAHANATTRCYGVLIMSINIISASPLDENLTRSLASGAVAAAEALQSETAAKASAAATLISARAEAESELLAAETKAEVERRIAEGDRAAQVLKAEGEAEAIELVANAISKGGKDAVVQRLAEQYLTAIPDIAKSAKMVMMPSTSPIDVSAMLTTATTITDVVRKTLGSGET